MVVDKARAGAASPLLLVRSCKGYPAHHSREDAPLDPTSVQPVIRRHIAPAFRSDDRECGPRFQMKIPMHQSSTSPGSMRRHVRPRPGTTGAAPDTTTARPSTAPSATAVTSSVCPSSGRPIGSPVRASHNRMIRSSLPDTTTARPSIVPSASRKEIQRRPARSIRCTRRCARRWGVPRRHRCPPPTPPPSVETHCL